MWMRVRTVDEDVAMQEQPRTVPCLSPDTASAVSRPLVSLSVNVSLRYIDLLDSTRLFPSLSTNVLGFRYHTRVYKRKSFDSLNARQNM